MVTDRVPLYGDVMTSAGVTSHRVQAALSALWSAATWRATRSALAACFVALLGGVLLVGLVLIWGGAAVSLAEWPVGGWGHAVLYIAMVAAGPVLVLWAVQGLTAVQRARLHAMLGVTIPAGSRAADRKPWPVGPWLAAATWRQLGFHLLALVTGVGGGGLVAVCWLAPLAAIGYLAAGHPPAAAAIPACLAAAGLLLAAPWLAQRVSGVDEASARALLGPTPRDELAQRVESLARSRADLVAAADAERRRIERDLHDGAQQRLVSLAMNLGLTRERFASAPEPVRQAIAEAHDEAVLALTELREFIRGLHPAVLNDRGLNAALSGLAARAPVPVTLHVDLAQPASPSVEAVAYFIVSEALTNVVKHAQATRAEVTATRRGDLLRITVTDDGRGGAKAATDDDGTGRQRTAGPGPAGRRGGWHAGHRQPAGRADRHHRGAAMRIVIAEDSVLLRDGLTRMLTDGGGFEVVAAVPDADQLLRAVAEHQPDLAVIDVRMPPTHTDEGIRAALVIRRQYPEVALLVLSQYVEESYATDLLSAATSSVGYLLKDRVAQVGDFLDAVRRVAGGGTALDPEVVAQLLVRRRDDPMRRLTPGSSRCYS